MSHKFNDTAFLITVETLPGFSPRIESLSVRCGIHIHTTCSYGHWLFIYILILQTIIVLLVMSFVVVCFLHFKRSTKTRSPIDLELQDLVIKHPDTADDVNHNTDCKKKKSPIATIAMTDELIESKLPDIISSRD